MRTEIASARDVSGHLEQAWDGLRAKNPALASPYFCTEFTRLVGEVRDDAVVLVCEEAGRVVALLPLQRSMARIGRPLGGPLSDYQALIAHADTTIDPLALLHGARLDLLLFDHWHGAQSMMRAFATKFARSPCMDLSLGFAAYERSLRARGSDFVPDIRRRARKLAREVGPLRYETHVDDPKVLERVLAWKALQSAQTGSPPLFAHRWAREIVARIHAMRSENFAGMLSALWAGDRLVAGHFGMRSRSVWHYWFPSYDREVAKYSPGLCLLLHMAEAAPSLGIHAIDFGKGDQRYKDTLSSRDVPLFEGRVFSTPIAQRAVTWVERSADKLRRTPLRAPARYPARMLRCLRDWAVYR